MEAAYEFIPSGGVTSPVGFRAGAACAGVKYKDRLDIGILHSEAPCAAAAVFTTNQVKAAPVVLSRERLRSGRAVAVVANSGCANACTGSLGLADAEEMAEIAARHIGVSPDDVLVASTGVIGQRLPMERIRARVGRIVLADDGGHDFAKAIMTTDTVTKEAAVRAGENGFIIGGTAKGAGMIHPDLATLLCFLTTDAGIDSSLLGRALREVVDASFNMVSIDGDSSTNDMVLIMANGRAGGEKITTGSRQADVFQQALNQVCVYLAKAIARDGEGATKFIEVVVSGAASLADARKAARTVVSSPLVKSAVHGSDPNWGRVLAAVGRSGVAMEEARIDLSIGGIALVREGLPLPFIREEAVNMLNNPEVLISLDLNMGGSGATAWGCDLSEEYVRINSEYTT